MDWRLPTCDGASIRINQTGDIIDDIVGSMVNQRVIVSVAVHQKTGKLLYRDMQREE
jgi:hypothetical protein